MCGVLRPLKNLDHPYYVQGVQAQGGAVAVGNVGIDVVFDLWNQQAATFYYGGGGLGNLLGGGVSAYTGYGFGNKSSVIDAWSGIFASGSLSATIPLTKVGVGASGFSSDDGSLIGGVASASLGINFLNEVVVDVAATAGKWFPFDRGTNALGSSFWFVSPTTATDAFEGTNYNYLQFANGGEVRGLALMQVAGTGGTSAAATAVAISVIRNRGISIRRDVPRPAVDGDAHRAAGRRAGSRRAAGTPRRQHVVHGLEARYGEEAFVHVRWPRRESAGAQVERVGLRHGEAPLVVPGECQRRRRHRRAVDPVRHDRRVHAAGAAVESVR